MIRRRLGPLSTFALCAALAGCQSQSPPGPSPSPSAGASAPTAAGPAPATAPASGSPAPPPGPPLPVELPTDLDLARLQPVETCAKRACTLTQPFPRAAKSDPATPAAVWQQRLEGRDAKLTAPTSRDGSLYGLVLKGRVLLSSERARDGATLEPYDTFYSERGGIALGTADDEASVLLVHVTPAPTAGTPPGPPGSGGGRPFEVRRARDQTELVWGRGAFRARPAFEGPERPASFGLLRSAAAAPIAPHAHEGAWEILIALRADGTLRLDRPSAPNTARKLEDGQSVAIAPDLRHNWEPAGTRPLIGVQLYIPPGAEQRFRKLAAEESARDAPPPPPAPPAASTSK